MKIYSEPLHALVIVEQVALPFFSFLVHPPILFDLFVLDVARVCASVFLLLFVAHVPSVLAGTSRGASYFIFN